MKNLIALSAVFFFASIITLHAQTASDNVNTATDSVTAVKTPCHGAATKPACCAKSDAQVKCSQTEKTSTASAKKSKKKKGEATCCAGKEKAACCANSKSGKAEACHPGCEMACCKKKTE